MATVRAPFLSLSAHGHVGDLVYTSRMPSGPRVAKLTPASGSPSTAQAAHRALVRAGMDAWNTRNFTSRDAAAWAAMLRRSPESWSTYNAFLSNFLEYPHNGEPWTQPRVTGIDHLAGPALALYVGAAGISTAPTLEWGYTPSLEQPPHVGFPAPWHGGDWGMNNTLNRAGALVWWRVVLSASSDHIGATPLAAEQF